MSAQKPTGHKEKKKERHRLHGSHCSLEWSVEQKRVFILGPMPVE
jgi:hypothetical protein